MRAAASETTRLVHGKFSFSRFVPKYCPILTMGGQFSEELCLRLQHQYRWLYFLF